MGQVAPPQKLFPSWTVVLLKNDDAFLLLLAKRSSNEANKIALPSRPTFLSEVQLEMGIALMGFPSVVSGLYFHDTHNTVAKKNDKSNSSFL